MELHHRFLLFVVSSALCSAASGMKLTTARIGGAKGIAITRLIMSYTVGSSRVGTGGIFTVLERFHPLARRLGHPLGSV
jgi:hypothetical protein